MSGVGMPLMSMTGQFQDGVNGLTNTLLAWIEVGLGLLGCF